MDDDKKAATRGYVRKLLQGIADGLPQILRGKFDALEKRISELERTALHDAGVFEDGKSYRAGAVTTFKNSAWVARTTTSAQPGKSPDWRMLSRGQ